MTTELTPEFTVGLRGYDKSQVDDYVDTLREWLDVATSRMQAAEAEAGQLREHVNRLHQRVTELEGDVSQEPPRSLYALGDRVARILALAEEGAEAVRADAEAAATDLIAHAQQEADELIRRGETHMAEAEAWVRQATHQAEQTVGQAEQRAALAAAQLTSEAETLAAGREAQAEQRARQLVEQAEAEAARLAEAARVERARTLQEFAARREELGGHIRALEAQRDEVMAALADLRESLHRTIGQLPVPGQPAAASSAHPAEPAQQPAATSGPPAQPEQAGQPAGGQEQAQPGRQGETVEMPRAVVPDEADTMLFDQYGSG